MVRIFYTLFMVGLSLQLLSAQEVFLNKGIYVPAQLTLSEKYCKHTSQERTFCRGKTLSYPDCDDPDLPKFLQGAKRHIEPAVKTYKDENLKRAVLSDIKDLGKDLSGEWYNASIIKLFSKTENTYTLSTASNGYTGGAHGYDAMHFDNYSLEAQKRLTLDDLFVNDYNRTLTQIAQKHYRQTRGLKAKQSLTEDGWFENRFVLAENFALTPEGIYFHYNSYEIKPYASGHTTFLLPYYKLSSIIDPKGPLAFALKHTHTVHAEFQDEQMQIVLHAKRHADRITVTATMTSEGSAKQGWLSVSFPQLKSKKILIDTQKNRFDHLISYDGHNRIYNVSSKKAMKARYLLVEADKKQWGYGETYSMQFTLGIPKGLKELILDVRGTLKADRTYLLPDSYEGITGQQGYHNYRVFLGL